MAKYFEQLRNICVSAQVSPEEVQDILGAELVDPDPNGDTLVHYAVFHNEPAVLEALLACGADPSVPNNEGVLPLALAVRANAREMYEQLVEHPLVDVNVRDNDGQAPVYVAAALGHTALFKDLVAKGAAVDVASKRARITPLHIACVKGHVEIVQTLLAHETYRDGADSVRSPFASPTASPPQGSALGEAVSGSTPARVNLRLAVETTSGATPLHCATLFNHKDIVQLLLDHGAPSNVRSLNGSYPRDLTGNPVLGSLLVVSAEAGDASGAGALGGSGGGRSGAGGGEALPAVDAESSVIERALRLQVLRVSEFLESCASVAAVIAPLARKAKGNPIGKNDQKLFQPMERVHEALMTSQQALFDGVISMMRAWGDDSLNAAAVIVSAYMLKGNVFIGAVRTYLDSMSAALVAIEKTGKDTSAFEAYLGFPLEQSFKEVFGKAILGMPHFIALCRGLVRVSIESYDLADDDRAVEKMTDIIARLEEVESKTRLAGHQSDDRMKLITLAEKMHGFDNLAVRGRSLIHEGYLTKTPLGSGKHKKRYFFLFNDTLVFCATKRGKYEVKGRVDLISASLRDVRDSEDVVNAMQLEAPRGTLLLYADTPADKGVWMRAVRGALEKLQSTHLDEAMANSFDMRRGTDSGLASGANSPAPAPAQGGDGGQSSSDVGAGGASSSSGGAGRSAGALGTVEANPAPATDASNNDTAPTAAEAAAEAAPDGAGDGETEEETAPAVAAAVEPSAAEVQAKSEHAAMLAQLKAEKEAASEIISKLRAEKEAADVARAEAEEAMRKQREESDRLEAERRALEEEQDRLARRATIAAQLDQLLSESSSDDDDDWSSTHASSRRVTLQIDELIGDLESGGVGTSTTPNVRASMYPGAVGVSATKVPSNPRASMPPVSTATAKPELTEAQKLMRSRTVERVLSLVRQFHEALRELMGWLTNDPNEIRRQLTQVVNAIKLIQTDIVTNLEPPTVVVVKTTMLIIANPTDSGCRVKLKEDGAALMEVVASSVRNWEADL